MIITPKLRADVSCFGSNECYPLAFGLPAILMTVALIIFVIGRSTYVINVPERNVIVDTVKAIWIAGRQRYQRWRSGSEPFFSISSHSASFSFFLKLPLKSPSRMLDQLVGLCCEGIWAKLHR